MVSEKDKFFKGFVKKELKNIKNRLDKLENYLDKGISKEGKIIQCYHCEYSWITRSKPENAEDDTTLYLEVCDINGRSRRRISQLELDCFDFPKWRNNDFVYFKTTPSGEKDTEIFAANKNGKIWRITDNDVAELNVQVFP